MSAQPTFSNEPVAAHAIPALTAIAFSGVSPSYRTLNMSVAALVIVVVAGLITAIRFIPWLTLPEPLIALYPVALVAVMTVGCLWLGYHWLADPRVGYALREQDISLTRGLVFRKVVCQPILRVQHVQLKRGPLDRLAGLACLQVFSAGGAMHTFEIPGLAVAQAEQIRQFILDHKDLSAR
ncbi:PH domain-containing protein [Alteromonas halophila]|uniref:YdbS-like PH domain-containing protein n=1 Tax=Alteromonas halophila TaxID=516698 RepID=A0A918JQM2_9ALTE|nr:PH domain-containing protein [Alteromonas halophila]GGW97846.1 hypothetical protein GCM10007391_34800 [Alteromonas halophila]